MPLTQRHEQDRLESLRSYAVLDTPPEAAYDAITELAARLCDAPMALISLSDADRQVFKSHHGTALTEVPAAGAFCPYVVGPGRPLVVRDATADPRFTSSPAVTGPPGLRSYAGVPLVGRDGLPLGTLCVLDTEARDFTTDQVGALATLGDHVVHLLELRRVDQALGLRPSPDDAPLQDARRLRQALDEGELVPHFQPMVDLGSGRVAGLEALLRWHHPERGTVAPGAFLPAVESSGLMMPVGRRVLADALRMLAALEDDPRVPRLIGMAVNVSLVQLAQPGLHETVLALLEQHGVAPGRLSLELTETAALLDDRVALDGAAARCAAPACTSPSTTTAPAGPR